MTRKKRKVVRYATKERKGKILEDNLKVYDKYLKSRISRNRDVKDSTYKQYESSMNIFLCYLACEQDNQYLLDEDFVSEEFIDVIDEYIFFLQDTLHNNKKRVNFHLSTISSFYIWALERREVQFNPMNNVTRIKNAKDEKIIDSDFLSQEEVDKVYAELDSVMDEDYDGDYDIIDQILWSVMFFSTSRIGAIHQLTLSSLVLDEEKNLAYFADIREKRGKMTSVVIDIPTYNRVQNYIKWREEKGIDSDYLFVSFFDKEWRQMSKNGLYNRIRKIGKIVGLDRFRPHSVRKSAANLYFEKYGIEKTQAILLHDDSSTTMNFYVKEKSSEDVFASILNPDNDK